MNMRATSPDPKTLGPRFFIVGQVMATVKRWGFAGFIHFLKDSQQNNRVFVRSQQ